MVNPLVDIGTQDWIMSWDGIHRAKSPTEPRPRPLIIRQGDGAPTPNSGTHLTQPLTFRIGNHLDRNITCEIALFAEDLVIPHRWLTEHQPTIHWGTKSFSFDSNSCIVNGCFTSCYDVYKEDTEEMIIRLLRLSPNLKKQMTLGHHLFWVRASVNEALADVIPMDHQEYAEMFILYGASRLPDRSECDHHIPLMEGTQPP